MTRRHAPPARRGRPEVITPGTGPNVESPSRAIDTGTVPRGADNRTPVAGGGLHPQAARAWLGTRQLAQRRRGVWNRAGRAS